MVLLRKRSALFLVITGAALIRLLLAWGIHWRGEDERALADR
jgi:hypothetical protein